MTGKVLNFNDRVVDDTGINLDKCIEFLKIYDAAARELTAYYANIPQILPAIKNLLPFALQEHTSFSDNILTVKIAVANGWRFKSGIRDKTYIFDLFERKPNIAG